MKFSDLFEAEYITIESYRKIGQGVRTPVWQVPDDGKLYVWTCANSGKVKRILNNDNVRVCVCDMVGNPSSEWVPAKANVILDRDKTERQVKRLQLKYAQMPEHFEGNNADRIIIEISAV